MANLPILLQKNCEIAIFLAEMKFADFYQYFSNILILQMFANFYCYFLDF